MDQLVFLLFFLFCVADRDIFSLLTSCFFSPCGLTCTYHDSLSPRYMHTFIKFAFQNICLMVVG